jgi:hypothetical protein
MKHLSRSRRVLWLAVVLAFTLVVAGCGDDDADTTTTTQAATTTTQAATTTTQAATTTTAAETTTTAAETTTTEAEGGGAPGIPADHEGREQCVACHAEGVGGATPIPDEPDHSAFDDSLAVCSACHAPEW